MVRQVENFCRKNDLFQRGDTVLLACSGGPDSLALLHVFLQLRERWQLRLCVLHFEHGIRGAASREDAVFVQEFCRENGVECRVEAADVPAWAAAQHLSLETAARELRYGFFHRVRQSLGRGSIAVAHHADDQAETVLMHLLRGTGTEGLAGMKPKNGVLIRPFLAVRRSEIEAYCRRHKLQPRHDATNDCADCTRNRIRLELLPELQKNYNPEIVPALCRLADVSREENAYLRIQAVGTALLQEQGGQLLLPQKAFTRLAIALQRRVLREAALRLKLDGLSFERIEAVRTLLLTGKTGDQQRLPGGFQVQLSYGNAVFRKLQAAAPVFLAGIQIPVPGKGCLPEAGLEFQADFVNAYPLVHGPAEAFFDFDALPGPLSLRFRQPGDTLLLEQGRKKLKEFLIDVKVPQQERDKLPLFCAGTEILWVAGWRRTLHARVQTKTKHILRIRVVQEKHKEKERGF